MQKQALADDLPTIDDEVMLPQQEVK